MIVSFAETMKLVRHFDQFDQSWIIELKIFRSVCFTRVSDHQKLLIINANNLASGEALYQKWINFMVYPSCTKEGWDDSLPKGFLSITLLRMNQNQPNFC